VASELIASLRSWSIEDIQIGERIFRIPALAADAWLESLLHEDFSPWMIVPQMLEPDDAEDYVTELMLAGEFSREEYEELAWELLGIAAGRDWWTALYLVANAKHFNTVDVVRAKLIMWRIDASTVSLAAWLDAIYAIYIEHMKPEDRQKFDAALLRPPPGIKAVIDRRKAQDSFRQTMRTAQ